MDFAIFNKNEVEEMFQAMFEHMPEHIRKIAVDEFGSEEAWREHYIRVASSEKMQKNYAKVVEWYGGKDACLAAAKNPLSKEVVESYSKRLDAVLQKLNDKRNCGADSFEVKEIIGEFGFVMKQISQVRDEKGIMLKQAECYRNNSLIKTSADEKYGEGAAAFFADAIEAFYRNIGDK